MFSSYRPYLNLRGNEIKVLYDNSQDHIAVLRHISEELSYRRSFAMLKLKKIVDEKISDISSNFNISSHVNSNGSDEIVSKKDKSEKNAHLDYKEKISFLELIKKIARSIKPESLINKDIWNMFTRSLCDSDYKCKKMKDVANSLDLIWPESNIDDEISDYIEFDFYTIKNNFGFEQKRVIISAISIASYSEVKSFETLNEKYGIENNNACESKDKVKFIRRCGHKERLEGKQEICTEINIENKITLNMDKYYFMSLLKFKAPWNYIEQSVWDEWRSKINQKQQMLTLADVAEIGQFNCNDGLRDFTIGELLNFELRHLNSFSDPDERRSVFYAVAFFGLGNDCPSEPKNPSTFEDPRESTAVDDILSDFCL